MSYQDDLHSADVSSEQPTMELLEGVEAAAPKCCSFSGRIARGSLYGVMFLSATALLAISAVPELANYATFIPDNTAKGTCHLSSGSCTSLDVASLKNIEGSPCCPLQAALTSISNGGCSRSCSDSQALASVSAEGSTCCRKSSSCCEEDGECPLTLAEASADSSESEVLVDATLAKLPEANEPPAPPVAE